MKEIRTYKLKLIGDYTIFEENCSKFLAACNFISPIIFETKVLSSPKLQREFYATIRENFGLGSQLCCSLFKHVVAAYKSMKSNEQWTQANFKNLTFPVVWRRDFNASHKGLTFWKTKFKLQGKSIPPMGGWKDSIVKKICGEWYLFLRVEIDPPSLKETGNVIGIDVGLKNIFVAKNMKNGRTKFCKGGELISKKQKIQRVRAVVRSVGTRSAKKLLKRLSGKEKSVTYHLLHNESKKLVRWMEEQNARVVVFEDLTGIRKSASKKGKRMRKEVNQWSFLQFQMFVIYKAREKGISTKFVNPAYTSKTCPRCGYCADRNRKGIYFSCKECGFSDHSDRIGATNIAQKFILGRQACQERADVNQLIERDQTIDLRSSHQSRPGGS